MIKAVETRYRGYRFRSRLEARWAVFFDAMGWQWEYEPEGFDLGGAGWYLPDFYLPQINAWIEIKGGKATDEEISKCNSLFSAMTGSPVATDLLALGEPKITIDFTEKVSEIIKEKCGSDEADGGMVADAIEEVMQYNLSRSHVYLFEGLLDNGWFCLGEYAVQCIPYKAIYAAIGSALFSRSEEGFEKEKKDINRNKLIQNALTKARSARFEHGENPGIGGGVDLEPYRGKETSYWRLS